jgi:hypothetical protein
MGNPGLTFYKTIRVALDQYILLINKNISHEIPSDFCSRAIAFYGIM